MNDDENHKIQMKTMPRFWDGTVSDLFDQLKRQLDLVPESYQNDAEVDFDEDENFFTIFWDRYEMPNEKRERIESDKAALAGRIESLTKQIEHLRETLAEEESS